MQTSIRQGSAICRPTHHHRRRKVHPDRGACCVLIAATAKVPRCQMSLPLVDVRCFSEIVPEVVAKLEDHQVGLVVAHLSSRRGYPIHEMPQRWTLGTEVRISALAGPEFAEGWIGFPKGTPPSCPGLSYPHRSPCSPTVPPHRQIPPLLLDLSTRISAEPTSIRQRNSAMLRTCELPTREPQ